MQHRVIEENRTKNKFTIYMGVIQPQEFKVQEHVANLKKSYSPLAVQMKWRVNMSAIMREG
jgi:hypothetical protein